jgi:cysteine desulfurase
LREIKMKIYMDYGSAHPVDQRVLDEMMPYFSEDFGNPASFHSEGFKALEALNNSRGRVASLIGAEPEEIFFTSGATESNNLGILGAANRYKRRGKKIIISAIEHISIINIGKELSKQGFDVSHCPVDGDGLINLDKLDGMLDDETILVSLMAANGEVGTIQPIKEAAKIIHNHEALFHTDATAANGQIPLDVGEIDLDLMTLSSNDLYGPKGVGALYLREGLRVTPRIIGGGQERGLRSGSENIPGIVGMGIAAKWAEEEMAEESSKMTKLRDRLIGGILTQVPESYLNGHPTKRLPNNANIRFSYIEGEAMVLSLDDMGIQVSTGSACAAKTLEPSHVCLAMGLKHEEAHGSLVFTLGRRNNEEQVDYVINNIPEVISKLREISPLVEE